MNWQKYDGGNPIIQGEGFWTGVTYSYYNCPTNAFISLYADKAAAITRVNAIGHIWFPDGPNPGGDIYFFDKNGVLCNEAHSSKINIGGSAIVVPDEVADKIIFIATHFRDRLHDLAVCLDACIKDMMKKTEGM